MSPPCRRPKSDLFWASLTFHVALCMAAVSFRNLGWETRARWGRLDSRSGEVVSSVADGQLCGKTGRCQTLYETTVGFVSDHERVFSVRSVRPFQQGATVRIEHARGRPGLARVAGTPSWGGFFAGLLTAICGLGIPLVVGGAVMTVSSLKAGVRPDRAVALAWLAGMLAEATLAFYFYWL